MSIFTAPKNLHERVALVTGAASGIGRALSLELARWGAHLILVDRNEVGLQEVARLIRPMGREVSCIGADLSTKEGVNQAVRRAIRQMGQVDVLVNNTGIMPLGPVRAMSVSGWEMVVDINVWAPVRMTNLLLPQMLERGHGHVVNVASVAGLLPVPGMTAYVLSKFAMVGYTEALRAELADEGIDVTCICPGFTRTGLAKFEGYGEGGLQEFGGRLMEIIGASPERVALQIVRAIRNRKGLATPGTGGTLLPNLFRLSPNVVLSTMSRVYPRMGMAR